MIFSPWGPYQDRTIPGSDYRSEKINGATRNFGGFDAIRLPQFILLSEAAIAGGTGTPVALLERYQGLTGTVVAESWQATLGDLYGTQAGADLIDRAFWWFWDSVAKFGNAEALVLYQEVLRLNTAIDPDLTFYLAAGAFHSQTDVSGSLANIVWPEGYVVPNWSFVWSVWCADDIPSGNGGRPSSQFGENPGYTIYEGPTAVFDPDVPYGSAFRTPAEFDLMRQGEFTGVLVGPGFPDAIVATPWNPGV